MSRAYSDYDYLSIVKHILTDDEFLKIKESKHHGVSRFDHSLKVSYISYKISKALKLHHEDTARGGLLHDFFLSDDDANIKDKLVSTFVHPKKAVRNSMKHFDVSLREADIIRAHMFPINILPPKYMEGWVVNFVDKGVALCEFSSTIGFKLKFATNLFLLFLINFIK